MHTTRGDATDRDPLVICISNVCDVCVRNLKQPDILPSRETAVTPPAAPALRILTTERIASLAGKSGLQARQETQDSKHWQENQDSV